MTFEVIPAIDLRGGRCVRLYQGDYARETAYSDDPLGVALRWEDLGAPRLHVVDLDGAREGAPVNHELMKGICAVVAVPVEVSGGVRGFEALAEAFAYGAERVQLGSAAVRDPDFVREAVKTYRGGIVVAIDARDGEVMTDGWTVATGRRAIEVAREMASLGVERIMFTDVSRDGALEGPNIESIAALVQCLDVPVIAAGGVSKIAHLLALAEAGCEGAIVGKALYEGAIELPEALAALAAHAALAEEA